MRPRQPDTGCLPRRGQGPAVRACSHDGHQPDQHWASTVPPAGRAPLWVPIRSRHALLPPSQAAVNVGVHSLNLALHAHRIAAAGVSRGRCQRELLRGSAVRVLLRAHGHGPGAPAVSAGCADKQQRFPAPKRGPHTLAARAGCVIEGGNSYLPTACGAYLSAVRANETIAVAVPVEACPALPTLLPDHENILQRHDTPACARGLAQPQLLGTAMLSLALRPQPGGHLDACAGAGLSGPPAALPAAPAGGGVSRRLPGLCRVLLRAAGCACAGQPPASPCWHSAETACTQAPAESWRTQAALRKSGCCRHLPVLAAGAAQPADGRVHPGLPRVLLWRRGVRLSGPRQRQLSSQ